MGWDVVATDLPVIVDSVLERNIRNNSSVLPLDSGTAHARSLDWTVPPEEWSWDNPKVIGCAMPSPSPTPPGEEKDLLGPPFDLIITADTVFSPALTTPLLRTLKAMCDYSVTAGTKAPPIYLCLERRDPLLVDQVLADAAKIWTVKRVPHNKLSHAMQKSGLEWDKSEWEDVEIWTFTQLRY